MKMRDVQGAYRRVETKGRALQIDRTGTRFPSGGHFQGIQMFSGQPNRLVISSSSSSRGYLVVCAMGRTRGKDGRVERVVNLASSPLDHAGGLQQYGRGLAVGLEDDNDKKRSQIQFWRMGGSSLGMLAPLTINRRTGGKSGMAGAVGVTSMGRETLLAVGTWGSSTIDFYRASGNPFVGTQTRFRRWKTWRKSDAIKTGWIDKNFGGYQSLNLIEQVGGRLFMIGFHRASRSRDFMDLYEIHPERSSRSMIVKIDKRHMTARNGASFQKGAGIHITSPTRMDVWAVKGTSGSASSGKTITVNRFIGRR